jgi:hypothetical protein
MCIESVKIISDYWQYPHHLSIYLNKTQQLPPLPSFHATYSSSFPIFPFIYYSCCVTCNQRRSDESWILKANQWDYLFPHDLYLSFHLQFNLSVFCELWPKLSTFTIVKAFEVFSQPKRQNMFCYIIGILFFHQDIFVTQN